MLSVVICTYNRAEQLGGLLKLLAKQTLQKSLYEILVVDNNSKDHTFQIVSRFPEVKYLVEKRQGIAFARNTGIRNTKYDIVVFLDDDVRPKDIFLLEKYYRFWRSSNNAESFCAMGGSVSLPPHHKLPHWAKSFVVRMLLGILDHESSRVLAKSDILVTANLSYRKEIFEKVGFFDTSLGRKGSSLFSNEDTEMQYRAQKKGFNYYYCHDVEVEHHFPVSRLTRRWVLKRAYYQGKSDCLYKSDNELKVRLHWYYWVSFMVSFIPFSPFVCRVWSLYFAGRLLGKKGI